MSFPPNVVTEVKRDSTGKLIDGPIFFKTDSGRGSKTNSRDNLVLCGKIHLKGVYHYYIPTKITKPIQEMDDIYEKFKVKKNEQLYQLFAKNLGSCINFSGSKEGGWCAGGKGIKD